jgi:exopolysaccharide biosynthesis polyprenyl glycosylphosphotransferase
MIFFWSVLLGAVWMSVAFATNSYEHSMVATGSRSALNICKTTIITWLLYQSIPYLTPILPGRRWEIFFPILVSLPVLSVWRAMAGRLVARPQFGMRVIVVGPGSSSAEVIRLLLEGHSTLYQVLGSVGPPPDSARDLTSPHLGTYEDLAEICHKMQVDKLILTTELTEVREELLDSLLISYEQGVMVTSAAELMESLTGKVQLRLANDDLRQVLLFLRPSSFRIFTLGKRQIDVLAGLVGLAGLTLILPLVAVGNALFNRGPLFYSQIRVGAGGRLFRLFKLRSMIIDAEKETGAVCSTVNDPRIPAWGRFLRKSRLDEFPQFWNVLKGEMSLVGPRPERPEFVDNYVKDVRFYRARHSVRPGLTGWAQVSYPYGETAEDTLEKLQYDLFYVKYQSFYLDYVVTLKTFQVVLGLKGR